MNRNILVTLLIILFTSVVCCSSAFAEPGYYNVLFLPDNPNNYTTSQEWQMHEADIVEIYPDTDKYKITEDEKREFELWKNENRY